MTKLTKQGVRDLGGNTRKPPTTSCSHTHGTKRVKKNITAWSTIWGSYETKAEVVVCNKCGADING